MRRWNSGERSSTKQSRRDDTKTFDSVYMEIVSRIRKFFVSFSKRKKKASWKVKKAMKLMEFPRFAVHKRSWKIVFSRVFLLLESRINQTFSLPFVCFSLMPSDRSRTFFCNFAKGLQGGEGRRRTEKLFLLFLSFLVMKLEEVSRFFVALKFKIGVFSIKS